jgi:hypothetical protein
VSRGASITASGRKAATAFEVEIENFWVDRLCKLAPGKVAPVWLTPRWTLTTRYVPLSVRVGGSVYNREIALGDFREDCFEALQGAR